MPDAQCSPDTAECLAVYRPLVGDQVVGTPWLGKYWNYALRDGMRVPLNGEVAWVLPSGAKPYWRGRISFAAYEFGDPEGRSTLC